VYRNHLIPPFPLADDFVPYLLRHTYCTDLKKQGVDLRIAKDLMGHADIKTTANIYDHDDGETLIMAARQMGLEVPSESA
jgi:site-specific recombinase XerD